MTTTSTSHPMQKTMTTNHQPIWPGGTYHNATPALEPSLIEQAVKCSGQNVKRTCASHLHRLHANLSQEQLLNLICQDCPARLYFASQAQAKERPSDKPALMTSAELPISSQSSEALKQAQKTRS